MRKKSELAVAIFDVECPKCGYTWTPEPNKWRNLNSVIEGNGKIIRCPACIKKIRLSAFDTENLIRQSRGLPLLTKAGYVHALKKKVKRVGKKHRTTQRLHT